jgi:DNA-binding response OmpR family regulator
VRILLLGEEHRHLRSLARRLRRGGFAVDEMGTIAGASEAIGETRYDCIILDRDVPDGDAVGLVGSLQTHDDRPSVFMMVQPGDEAGRVECLAAGADDAMAKPLLVEEFVLRVRKLIIRRTPGGAWVQLGDVSIDRARGVVSIADRQVSLSPLQYSVLEQLAIHAGGVVEQGWLLEHCWDARRDPFSSPLHSMITRLRRIFHGHLVIESARGSGYLLRTRPTGPSE